MRRRWDGLEAGSGSECCFSWRGDVSQIFNNEVMAHKNPDFWLCFRKPQVPATAGPQGLTAMSGGLSSRCPLLVFGLVTPGLIHVPHCTTGETEGPRGRGLAPCSRLLVLGWLSSLTSVSFFCPDPFCFYRESRDAFLKDWGVLPPAHWG